MPCNSVAVAGAQVAADHLTQYLTPDRVAAPIQAYLAAKFPDTPLRSNHREHMNSWSVDTPAGTYQITIYQGRVTVSGGRNPDTVQALAAELQQALTLIAARYWQAATYQTLAATYQVTESQPTADGSLIVRLRV